MNQARKNYTPGYTLNALDFMSRRTAESHAAFFLPQLKVGMRLLDCGCGPGGITVGLAERVNPGEVIGIDPGGAQLERARERARAANVPATFREATVYSLPFPEAYGGFKKKFVPKPWPILKQRLHRNRRDWEKSSDRGQERERIMNCSSP